MKKEKIYQYGLGFSPHNSELLEEGTKLTMSLNEVQNKGLDSNHLDLYGEVINGKLIIDIRGATLALKKLAKTFGLKLKWKV